MNYTPESIQEELLKLEKQKLEGNNIAGDINAIELGEKIISQISEQLSLTNEIETIRRLLKGQILDIVVENGSEVQKWVEPKDKSDIVLTDYGVYVIMNAILFYLNKNTLLSYYDEKTINTKMEDFATTLADDLFMEYEKVFNFPKFEECKKIFVQRRKDKIELRKFAYEIIGKEKSNEEIEKELFDKLEENIEKELTKIKDQLMKNKLKKFELIMRCVQDSVHSTYNRALFGAERRTLRQHIHVSENIGNVPNKPTKQSGGMLSRVLRR